MFKLLTRLVFPNSGRRPHQLRKLVHIAEFFFQLHLFVPAEVCRLRSGRRGSGYSPFLNNYFYTQVGHFTAKALFFEIFKISIYFTFLAGASSPVRSISSGGSELAALRFFGLCGSSFTGAGGGGGGGAVDAALGPGGTSTTSCLMKGIKSPSAGAPRKSG